MWANDVNPPVKGFYLLVQLVINQISEPTTGGTCNAEECHRVAKFIKNSMNQSAHPCDDFYEYACGNWYANNPLPNGVGEFDWDTLKQFTTLAEYRLREMLKADISDEDITPIRKMKKMYSTCIHDAEGLEPILKIFREAHGWPMIMSHGTWNKDAMTRQEIVHYYDHLMHSPSFWSYEFIGISLVIRPQTAFVDYTSPSEMELYRSVIKNITRLFIRETHASISDDQLDEDINDLISLERKLAQVPVIDYSQADPLSSVSTFLANLPPKAKPAAARGKIEREEIIRRLLTITNSSMVDAPPIQFNNLQYFDELHDLLLSTDQRTLANFIHWNFLRSMESSWPLEMVDILRPLHSVSRPCMNKEDLATQHLFRREFYGGTMRTAVDEQLQTMITNLKKAAKVQIEGSDYLSVPAQEAMKRNIEALESQLGYPEERYNETTLIRIYEDLTIGDSYFENALNYQRLNLKRKLETLGGVKEHGNGMPLLTIKTEYRFGGDDIFHPLINYQPPVLSEKLPKYFEYGAMGSRIAGQMGRVLHPKGLVSNNHHHPSYIDSNSTPTFSRNVECFIEKYAGDFQIFQEAANIVDWYGMQFSFGAYKKLRDEVYPNGELKLPKFEALTDEQMFFISFGQTHCSAQNLESISLTQNVHNRRVINVLSHTVGFAEAFHCSPKSPMNPEMKCNMLMKPDKFKPEREPFADSVGSGWRKIWDQ